MSEEIGAGRRALLHAFVDEVKANPRVEPRVFLATTYVDELLRGNASLRRQLAQAREENARLGKWVADLQSGMYVNCVYCGHRYGPGSTTPVSMADALKTHIENCPKHPMSALKSDNQRLQAIVDRLPKTADGVPVVQGDTLFGVSEIDGRIVRLTADEPTLWTAIEDLPDEGVSDERVWDFCVNAYSTREAAARAAEARVLQGGGRRRRHEHG